jgi:hypothetical protein
MTTVTSCVHINPILKGNNFDEGDWLLVHNSFLKDSLLVIDDEKVLKANAIKLSVDFSDDDQGTTCDGEILLYKNGRLVNSQQYLSSIHLHQSKDLEASYKLSQRDFFHFNKNSTKDFIVDSLLKAGTYYPVIDTPDNKGAYLFAYRVLQREKH